MTEPETTTTQQEEQVGVVLKGPYCNLPAQPTPIIGREQELDSALQLLRRIELHLLTITGTAGVGKTCLAVQVASKLREDFADGVCFVSLAHLQNPDLVIATITRTLRLKEAEDVFDLLKMYLHQKQLLLILDNFEQVISAAPSVAELLSACPEIKMIITSREVLNIRYEHPLRLSPLPVPDVKHLPDVASLAQNAAVMLFAQRARIVRPNFTINENNAQAIAEICARLDGLPLAIELAAGHSKLFCPQSILQRMNSRLKMLKSGARDLPERQQALRNALDWSYDLLNTEEQRLFRWLSVFVGGCTVKTAQGIYSTGSNDAENVVEGLGSLLDKSLLQHIDQGKDEPRFQMLETIREYGLEHLKKTGEMETAQRAHAKYFATFAEEAERELRTPQQALWLERLERDHENLRTALDWLLESNEQELALRLSGALGWFWYIHGHFIEGRHWLERALALNNLEAQIDTSGLAPALPDSVLAARAKALNGASMLLIFQDNYDLAEALSRESLALFRHLRNEEGIAFSLYRLGIAVWAKSNYPEARSLIEEALALFRKLGNQHDIAMTLIGLANVASTQHDVARARTLIEESLAILREVGDKRYIAFALSFLADLLTSEGDLSRAYALLQESLEIAREIGYKHSMVITLRYLALLHQRQGDIITARLRAEESLVLSREMGDRWGTAQALSLLASLAVTEENYPTARMLYEESLAILIKLEDKELIASCSDSLAEVIVKQSASGNPAIEEVLEALRLLAEADSLRSMLGIVLTPEQRATHERTLAAARTQLGDETFEAAWTEAQKRSAAVSQTDEEDEKTPSPTDEALSSEPLPDPLEATQRRASTHTSGLSSREIEVLRLVANGMTNEQIADKLVLSIRTVHAHMRSIYKKLEISSRSALIRYAIDNHFG